MVALLDAPPIRSGKRGYMDCGFPAAFVSRVILRSVRQARTASWQFSRLPRRPYSDRPEPPTRLLTHNRCPLLIVIYGLRGRLACSPDPSLRCTWVYRLPCTRSSPLYPQTCKDPQTIPRQDDPNQGRRSALFEHVYIALSIPADFTARDVHSGYMSLKT